MIFSYIRVQNHLNIIKYTIIKLLNSICHWTNKNIMVFLWAWRITGWRWLTHKHKNMPEYVSLIVFGSLLLNLIKSADPSLYELGPFTDSYRSNIIEEGNAILDDRKIQILASRRFSMLRDQQEAAEYFEKNGHIPRPTNRHIVLNDVLGY